MKNSWISKENCIGTHDRILDPAKEEIFNWAEEIFVKAKTNFLDKVKEENAGWVSHQTWYGLERYGNFLSMPTTNGSRRM